MFVPFITSSPGISEPGPAPKHLSKRKGGGGGGRGGGGGGRSSSGGKSSKSSSSGSKSSKSKSKPLINTGGKSYGGGGGGGAPAFIPPGQIFAGRLAGGGTRDQIYGTRAFGSGYPGISGRGVAGRGFPFFFWPLAWGAVAGGATTAYLYNDEYGLPSNTSRPGGPITTASFQSSSTSSRFHIMADNSTVTDLIVDLTATCSSFLPPTLPSSSPPVPVPYNGTPKPEQVVQYYRASSIALALDGYNNSVALGPDGTVGPDTLLPSGVDLKLMYCLNQTIGLTAPLVDGAGGRRWGAEPGTGLGVLGLAWVVWHVLVWGF